MTDADGYTRRGISQSVRIPEAQHAAMREYTEKYGLTMADALRAGLDLLLDCCPVCKRPLDHG